MILTTDLFLKLINKKLLIAVSGGIDSMVMLDILIKKKLKLSVAHANFQIRKYESEKDEYFVKKFCKIHKIKFYNKRFETNYHASENKISIQMSARYLRYKWFQYLLKTKKYDFLILGHNLNDSIETFFINLIRGTGIKGLIGINHTDNSNKIIRPLIGFTKNEIMEYAILNKIKWRNDDSNYDNKYLRNYIRNKIIPLIIDLPFNFYKSFIKTSNNLFEENIIIEKEIEKIINEITIKKDDNSILWKINFEKLKNIDNIKFYLNRIFFKYGFKNIKDLINIIKAEPGKKLFSKKYIILKDKKSLLLLNNNKLNNSIFRIEKFNYFNHPLDLLISKENKNKYISKISVDLKKIKLPLFIRKWNHGDYFHPLNCKKKIKISKYFINQKFSIFKKKQIWLLINSDNNIIWMIDICLDDRFKITNKTKNSINIYLLSKNNINY